MDEVGVPSETRSLLGAALEASENETKIFARVDFDDTPITSGRRCESYGMASTA